MSLGELKRRLEGRAIDMVVERFIQKIDELIAEVRETNAKLDEVIALLRGGRDGKK